MTHREMQKLIIINKVIGGTLTVKEAVQVLDLSPRQRDNIPIVKPGSRKVLI